MNRNIQSDFQTCMSVPLMKKVIILRKVQATIKTFVLSFLNHFKLRLNRNEDPEKETKHIFTLHLPIYYILEQDILTGANADITKTKREIQIVFIVERCMKYLLLRLKSLSAKEAAYHPTARLLEFLFLFLVQLKKMRMLGEFGFIILLLV